MSAAVKCQICGQALEPRRVRLDIPPHYYCVGCRILWSGDPPDSVPCFAPAEHLIALADLSSLVAEHARGVQPGPGAAYLV